MIDIPDSILPKNDQGQTVCPRCRNVASACTCPAPEPARPKTSAGPGLGNVYVRLEKSGRSGKAVTVVRRLPADENLLAALARELKMKAGCGGTYYIGEDGGTIELQGDRQRSARDFFKNKR